MTAFPSDMGIGGGLRFAHEIVIPCTMHSFPFPLVQRMVQLEGMILV